MRAALAPLITLPLSFCAMAAGQATTPVPEAPPAGLLAACLPKCNDPLSASALERTAAPPPPGLRTARPLALELDAWPVEFALELDAWPLELALELEAWPAEVDRLPIYERVTGREAMYVVGSGDSLQRLATRFGISLQLAAKMNQLANPTRLRPGQRLILSNRRVVPSTEVDGLVVDLVTLQMYWLRGGELVDIFPVAAGRKAWETPPGHYTIIGRQRDPVWHVPRSIQKEMRRQGKRVRKRVPPGPDNPLGKYWIQLSDNGIGIHGTNAPWSVGKYTTHGCIRLRARDIERLFREVPQGTRVDIIDAPIRLALLDKGQILLEAHHDRGPMKGRMATLNELLRKAGVADVVDNLLAERIVRDGWGVAVDIARKRRGT